MTTSTTPVSLLGIAGSLRTGSLNRALLRAAATLVPDGVSLTVFDLAAVPLYNGDVEAQGDPPSVVALKAAIRAADGLLIATPEYNYSIPGVLKNALDWASRPPAQSPLKGKPVGIMGATPGPGATLRGQLALRQALIGTGSSAMGGPELGVARAGEKFDAQGVLTDEATRTALGALLTRLADWTRRLRQA